MCASVTCRTARPRHRVVGSCETLGQRAVAVLADIGRDLGAEELFTAADELGPVSVLVNNAAMVLPPSRVEDCDAESLSRLFAVNAIGPFLCASQAIRRMARLAAAVGADPSSTFPPSVPAMALPVSTSTTRRRRERSTR